MKAYLRISFLLFFNFWICSSLIYNQDSYHSPCHSMRNRYQYQGTRSGFCVPNRHCCDTFLHNSADDKGDCEGERLCCVHTVICQDCLSGFKSHNNTCVDINECEEKFGVCSGHKCNNTIGSYECECFDSFEMIGDLKTCHHINQSETSDLLFTEYSRINFMPFNEMNSENIKMLYTATITPKSIDYSFEGNYMAWTDITAKLINIAPVNYRNPSSVMDRIILRNLNHPFILSIDWIHDLIYWSDLEDRTINVANFDQPYYIYTLVNTTTQLINDFKVNVVDSCLVWTYIGLKPRMMRSLQDGSNQSVLYSSDNQPFYVTIDVYLKRYFFVDCEQRILFSIDFRGNEEKRIVMSKNKLLSLITNSPIIYKDDICLITDSTLYCINKFGKDNVEKELFDIIHLKATKTFSFGKFIFDFKIVDPLLQPVIENKCQNSRCSHLCVPSDKSRGFRCLCPQTNILVNDSICVNKQFGNNKNGFDVLINQAISKSLEFINAVNKSIEQEVRLNITHFIQDDRKNHQEENGSGIQVLLVLILLVLLLMTLIQLTRFKIDLSRIKTSRCIIRLHPLYRKPNDDSIEEMESKT